MKTRLRFISNSSSSSFIIAGDENTEVAANAKKKVQDIASNSIYTLVQLDKYMDYEYGKEEYWSQWTYELYNNCKKAIYDGQIIYICHVSNDSGDLLNQCIYEGQYKLLNGKEIYQ